MSMSTQHGGGGTRRPASTKPGGKPKDAPVDKPGSAAKSASAGAGKKGARPTAGGGKGRKPITPVKVSQGRNWGPIVTFAVVGAIALGIIGFGGYQVYVNGMTWEDRAAKISGITNFRKSDAKMLVSDHVTGPVKYSVLPPVGGAHNINWQRCLGDVYDAPIANEHAVHSLEHGAVWITYRPGLAQGEIDKLASKVKGHDFTLMSPFPGLDKPISVQTWGYQLKVDKADDPRIDDFIKALREVSAKEPGATCSAGAYITETGTTPHDLQPPANSNGGMPALPGGTPGGTG
ncbi:DUF3105 domain-containing protein [Planosporangium flavigriseum]|uniref:DUF3105 domain-containing protein n=1 Tax=Planosporangium flavigriseum TaxID=373681 RepID=A0A8J3PPM7_9ACTN|nr:DUF3105 domain-containing protein [Planosporangium flavigriseum]NJC67767.1 DUF3105 domain-containing protein [Planosporangium flavigriseum]GIG76068.1 hypothetical protein Pfl04_44720 [Planosporangium flavigriseum]